MIGDEGRMLSLIYSQVINKEEIVLFYSFAQPHVFDDIYLA